MKALLPPFAALLWLWAGPSQAGRVDIVTSEQYYEIGETVFFTVTNGLDENILMPGFPYWYVNEYETGIRYAVCSSLPKIHVIAPGQSETHSWAQFSCVTGEPAPPGIFVVGLDYWTESDPTLRNAEWQFCVGFDCTFATSVTESVRSSSWGRVKALYR